MAAFGEDGHLEVSVYAGQPLVTNEEVIEVFSELGTLFPIVRERYDKEPNGWNRFLAIIAKQMKEREFTSQQLHDAYNRLLSTPTYNGQIEVSAIFNMEDKIKFYTYHETDCGTKRGFTSAGLRFKSNNEIAYCREQDRPKVQKMIDAGVRFI